MGMLALWTSIQLSKKFLKLLLLTMGLLVDFMKQPSLWTNVKLCYVFLPKIATKKNTKSLFKRSAKNIRFHLSRLIPIKNWANGQDSASSIKMEKLAKLFVVLAPLLETGKRVSSIGYGQRIHQITEILKY